MVMKATRQKKILIILALFLLVTLAIVTCQIRYPGEGPFLNAVLEVAAPVQSVLSSSLGALQDTWADYLHLVGLREENRRLNRKIEDLTVELSRYREGNLEAGRLRALLSLKQEVRIPSVAARVIDRNQATLFKTILVSKGTSSGVRVGQPVLSGRGIVGRVISASPNVSKVLLVIDEKSNIDALIQRSRTDGILQGNGATGAILKYVSNLEDVQAGDVILTSGLSGVFPKGLPLGSVVAVDRKADSLFQKIEVAPAADLTRLEEVLILDYKHTK